MELRKFLSVAAATAIVGTAVLMTGCGDDDSSTASGGGNISGDNNVKNLLGFWSGVKYTLGNSTETSAEYVTDDAGLMEISNTTGMNLTLFDTSYRILDDSETSGSMNYVDSHDKLNTEWGGDAADQLMYYVSTVAQGGDASKANETELDTTFNFADYEDKIMETMNNTGINTSSPASIGAYFSGLDNDADKIADLMANTTAVFGSDNFNKQTALDTFDGYLESYQAAIRKNKIDAADGAAAVTGFTTALVNNTLASVRYISGSNEGKNTTYDLTGANVTGAVATLDNTDNDFFELVENSYAEEKKANFVSADYLSEKNYVITAVTYDLVNGNITGDGWDKDTNRTLRMGADKFYFNNTGAGSTLLWGNFSSTFPTNASDADQGNFNGTWCTGSACPATTGLRDYTIHLFGPNAAAGQAGNTSGGHGYKTIAFTRQPGEEGFYAYVWEYVNTGATDALLSSSTPFYNASMAANISKAASTTWK